MSSNRILGTLHAVDGQGAVRLEDRYDTSIEDLWSAITDPGRLARWYGTIQGDLRVGGAYDSRVHASQWEGTSRIDVCEPPRRLVVTGAEPGRAPVVTEVTLTADGDQTILVLEQRGMPLEQVAGWGAGNQIHVEDLTAYLAGRERCDSGVRIEELFPAYAAMTVAGA